MKNFLSFIFVVFLSLNVQSATVEPTFEDEGFLWKKNLVLPGEVSLDAEHDDLSRVLSIFRTKLTELTPEIVDIIKNIMLSEEDPSLIDDFRSLNHDGFVMETLLEEWRKSSDHLDDRDYIDESFFSYEYEDDEDKKISVGELIVGVFNRLKRKNFCIGSLSYFEEEDGREYRVPITTTSVGHPVPFSFPVTCIIGETHLRVPYPLDYQLVYRVDHDKKKTLYFNDEGKLIWGAYTTQGEFVRVLDGEYNTIQGIDPAPQIYIDEERGGVILLPLDKKGKRLKASAKKIQTKYFINKRPIWGMHTAEGKFIQVTEENGIYFPLQPQKNPKLATDKNGNIILVPLNETGDPRQVKADSLGRQLFVTGTTVSASGELIFSDDMLVSFTFDGNPVPKLYEKKGTRIIPCTGDGIKPVIFISGLGNEMMRILEKVEPFSFFSYVMFHRKKTDKLNIGLEGRDSFLYFLDPFYVPAGNRVEGEEEKAELTRQARNKIKKLFSAKEKVEAHQKKLQETSSKYLSFTRTIHEERESEDVVRRAFESFLASKSELRKVFDEFVFDFCDSEQALRFFLYEHINSYLAALPVTGGGKLSINIHSDMDPCRWCTNALYLERLLMDKPVPPRGSIGFLQKFYHFRSTERLGIPHVFICASSQRFETEGGIARRLTSGRVPERDADEPLKDEDEVFVIFKENSPLNPHPFL